MIAEGQWHLRGPQLSAFMSGGPESTCWPHYNHCFPPWLCSIPPQGCQLCPLQKPTLAFFVLPSHIPVRVLHKVLQTNFKSFLKRSFQGPACFLFRFIFIYFLLVLLPCLEKLLQFSWHHTSPYALSGGLFCLPSSSILTSLHPILCPGSGHRRNYKRLWCPSGIRQVWQQRGRRRVRRIFTLLAPTLQSLRLAEALPMATFCWATYTASFSRLRELLPPLTFQARGSNNSCYC